MMIERSKKIDNLTTAFAVLSTTITNKSKLSMLDDNRALEAVLAELLNMLYGFNFVDLNREKHNHPAIDLGDISRGKAIQITADGSKDKMVESIGKLEKHGLNHTYKDITFLIISNSPKLTFQKKGYQISIKNFADIAKEICALPTESFDEIYVFCEKEFSDCFLGKSQSSFKPRNIPSKDPSSNIRNFMDRNGFDEPYKVNVELVRNGLIALKEKLSGLNDDQRWFLYKIMDYSINYNQENIDVCVAAPYDYLSVDVGESKLKTTFKSLESMKLAYFETEPTWNFEGPHFYLYFSPNVQKINLFSGICMFLADNFKVEKLEKIIIDCDFSAID